MKTFVCFLSVLAFFISCNADAGYLSFSDNVEVKAQPQENSADEENSDLGASTLVVTPLQECYAQLDKKDVEDIKNNYIKKYGECLKRLRIKEKNSNTLKVQKEKTEIKEEAGENKKIIDTSNRNEFSGRSD